MDPFDDVRGMAAGILKDFPSLGVSSPNNPMRKGYDLVSSETDQRAHITMDHQVLSLALTRAERLMSRTGRADFADGVGRLYDLTYRCCLFNNNDTNVVNSKRSEVRKALISGLEKDIMIAQENLRMAISTAPLHGRLIALRYNECFAASSQILQRC